MKNSIVPAPVFGYISAICTVIIGLFYYFHIIAFAIYFVFTALLFYVFAIYYSYKQKNNADIEHKKQIVDDVVDSGLGDFEFVDRLGVHRNKKDNLFYCTSCLKANPSVRSPLKVQENGWVCEIKSCGKFYPNPDYKDNVPYIVQHPDPFKNY